MNVFTQFDEPLRALWESAVAEEPTRWPFFTFAWHQAWHKHFGLGEHVAIMADPQNRVIIPLSIKDSVAHFTGGEEIADYLDAIGASAYKTGAWQEAISRIRELGATHLTLRNIPAGSPTLEVFRSAKGALVTQEDTTPTLTLPSSFDEYLLALDRKDRHELKRKVKKFEAEHQTLSFVPRTGSAIDMAPLLLLMRRDTEKAAFLTESMTRFFEELPAVFPEETWQFVLTQGDKIIAATLAFRTRDSLLLYNSGFDPQYPGAGWYIKVQTISWAIGQSIRLYNFLQGNERYKYDLGALDVPVYRITLPL